MQGRGKCLEYGKARVAFVWVALEGRVWEHFQSCDNMVIVLLFASKVISYKS